MSLPRLAYVSVLIIMAAATICPKASACQGLSLRDRVEVPAGTITLADLFVPIVLTPGLLTADDCGKFLEQAARISLGAPPRPGSVRVLQADQVRAWVKQMRFADDGSQGLDLRIPERIEIRRVGESKSCAEIARMLGPSLPVVSVEGPINISDGTVARTTGVEDLRSTLDCAAAINIPQRASLEFLRSSWNPGLQRWEFTVRCRAVVDCVPFLLFGRAKSTPPQASGKGTKVRNTHGLAEPDPDAQPIRPGQTAMLSWDQRGIRVLIQVTCLESGTVGQFVRVRLKNAERTLRVQVVGTGSVRLGDEPLSAPQVNATAE